MERYFQSLPAIIAYFKTKTPTYPHLYQQSLPELRAVDFGMHPLVRPN
jgi:hypothetical protein